MTFSEQTRVLKRNGKNIRIIFGCGPETNFFKAGLSAVMGRNGAVWRGLRV